MRTPICDFVRDYAEREGARFHMPGHKGRGDLGFEKYDITEICGADVLYSPEGVILESENIASELFGTAHSFYSTEGSTLCIKAMLRLVTAGESSERPLILAARNVHRAFVSAAALLDLEVGWIYPEEFTSLCSASVTPEAVERAISESPRKPSAVYITSPDYLGGIADVRGIAEVCHRAGVPLAVDNAHGAYLRFLSPSRHPVDLGADIICDSAHKTLPVLTGGAYLHISKNADGKYLERARGALSLFASTSPSYLILQSLDECNRYLGESFKEELCETVARVKRLKADILGMGIPLLEGEPLKVVFDCRGMGWRGDDFSEFLRARGIEIEFSDRDLAVLMIAPKNSESELSLLLSALSEIEKKEPLEGELPTLPRAERRVSVREAVFAESERVRIENAVGRVCADVCVSCPPAVPIAVSGEVITEETVDLLRYYGAEVISVVK
ncbi:MAG: amino acid decarboxylase [Ruminococcaceae bacterium]|nr:amino acid decarboxylase [Oscillospiraceae bacterium]